MQLKEKASDLPELKTGPPDMALSVQAPGTLPQDKPPEIPAPKPQPQVNQAPGTGPFNNPAPGTAPQDIPALRKWNWGAFSFGWLWGIGNRCWISLLCLVPVAGWIFSIVLGCMGNRWAFRSYKGESVSAFLETQATWSRAGLAAFIAEVAGFLMSSWRLFQMAMKVFDFFTSGR